MMLAFVYNTLFLFGLNIQSIHCHKKKNVAFSSEKDMSVWLYHVKAKAIFIDKGQQLH
jgi:hypothetical protein